MPSAAEPDPHPPRSPARRALFWCAMGVLYVVLALEWRAHRAHAEAADWLAKAVAKPPRAGEPLTRDDLLKQLGPSDAPADDIAATPPDSLTWSWRSLFQRYRVRVHLSPDAGVQSFDD